MWKSFRRKLDKRSRICVLCDEQTTEYLNETFWTVHKTCWETFWKTLNAIDDTIPSYAVLRVKEVKHV
jgi:hypothetical protein